MIYDPPIDINRSVVLYFSLWLITVWIRFKMLWLSDVICQYFKEICPEIKNDKQVCVNK